MILAFVLDFWSSLHHGWIRYSTSKASEGPKFTEEQIRMSDEATNILDQCYPVTYFVDPVVHLEICKQLRENKFQMAGEAIDGNLPPLPKWTCYEALKAGIWLLSCSSPSTLRNATFNLLACDKYFPRV